MKRDRPQRQVARMAVILRRVRALGFRMRWSTLHVRKDYSNSILKQCGGWYGVVPVVIHYRIFTERKMHLTPHCWIRLADGVELLDIGSGTDDCWGKPPVENLQVSRLLNKGG